jgi:hypothetical protein
MKQDVPAAKTRDDGNFWATWLFVVVVALSVFGVALALLSATPLFDLFHWQIDPVFWGTQPQAPATRDYQHSVYGVLGAVLAGWGSTLAFVAWFPFRAGQPWAWWCLGVGIVLWCVIDTGVSLAFRVFFNVAFNLVIFLATALPLGLTWAQFFGRTKGVPR